MLIALKQVISNYITPQYKEIFIDLVIKINLHVEFLDRCRTISIGMENAIENLKWNIFHASKRLSDEEIKQELIQKIDDYIRLEIQLPGKVISNFVIENKKIVNNDIIIVYACSSLVLKVLCDAHQAGIRFKVIVIDGRPKMEGKEMLRRLLKSGIKCSYMLINSISHAMRESTKVFLGVHGLSSNGCVISRIGSSQIALMTKNFNVPVLVCCETYKFCKKTITTNNLDERGNPDDLIDIGNNKIPYLSNWRNYNSLSLLNLTYDITPSEFILGIITEYGMYSVSNKHFFNFSFMLIVNYNKNLYY